MVNINTFNSWLKSDNVVKVSDDVYRTQCTLYRKRFTLAELKAYYKREYSDI